MLLQKEFPLLKSYVLPSYNIKYPKKGKNLKFKLFLSVPSIILAVIKEKKFVTQIAEKENLAGIISDNRFGALSRKVPSVYITHQLNVLSGKTTFLTSKIHQKIIEKFDECWVPDVENEPNFSEMLGHINKAKFKVNYLGILSRFKKQYTAIKYDLLVLLSGPEPQRTLLENKLLIELKGFNGEILFVRGVLSNKTNITAATNFKIIDFLASTDLEIAINQSEIVLARSGYSTIMDLAVLGKKAFFIPTPGQFEQEYLAEILSEKLIAPFATQQNFKATDLDILTNFSGFKVNKADFNLDYFSLFKRK
ncbi:glycosyltransferase [uncultured Lutibacter sp.]|uniref:glycosyltransferase n=1 Tax=uncultured Lutibacter sp. TaxID=437739 RepID=UPI00261DC7F8|nr:glycosyltransferase [uncultured Lutibacter sp.]